MINVTRKGKCWAGDLAQTVKYRPVSTEAQASESSCEKLCDWGGEEKQISWAHWPASQPALLRGLQAARDLVQRKDTSGTCTYIQIHAMLSHPEGKYIKLNANYIKIMKLR